MTEPTTAERAWRKWLLGYVRGRYRSTWLLVLREEWRQGFGQYSEHRKAFRAGWEAKERAGDGD